jgi:hypothetical protein
MRRIFPEGSAMDTRLSLASILSSLEAQVAHHREQESLHAEREAFHRGRRAEHAAELEQLVGHLETFQASAAGAVQLAARLPMAAPLPGDVDDLPIGRKVSINKLVARVVEDRAAEEPFGPRAITEEVNRRFAARLRAPLDMRQVSVALRWLVAGGRIVQQEKGRPHWESKYVRRGVG